MIGAYPDYATAIAKADRGGYADEEIVQANTNKMRGRAVWDYPVMLWINAMHRDGMRVLDAGGHFGMKYTAFGDLCPIASMHWTVYDLPTTINLARAAQKRREVPPEIVFQHDLEKVGDVDLLLASGLLQFLDVPLAELVNRLNAPPQYIILNKVATRLGPTVVTLEKIGPGRVPYQIRDRDEFEKSLTDMGYAIHDRWEIPSLSHVISTHPELGSSTSMGYVLQRLE
ncbi:methyltransferase, TIGR04325 family [Ruegeria atlantica]|uniref:methyltransferase, TIGR04325 family n=1 Tax=Ruegeria atlantica TaxID=81569 RepID=UPI001481455D|nr:methyltransferase, TIGR04325 family [Ruegeria atlantica]